MIKKTVKLCLLVSILSLQSSSHLFAMDDGQDMSQKTTKSCKKCAGKGWIEFDNMYALNNAKIEKMEPKKCTDCTTQVVPNTGIKYKK